jgi:hypothetical protein
MAETWWSKRFVDVLESYGLGGRMQRGRRYARAGQLLSLEVTAGLLLAQVQGSRRTPYVVSVRSPQPSAAHWRKLDATFRSRVGFAARLLAGEVPPDLEDAFGAAGVGLFPRSWADIDATCSCPDGANPCKHIAATLYVFADQLDRDPWLLLTWRGRTREQVLAHLRGAGVGNAVDARLPPWWPLAPGRAGATGRLDPPPAEPPDPPGRVLARLEPFDADIAGTALVDVLAGAYAALVRDDADPDDRVGPGAGTEPRRP